MTKFSNELTEAQAERLAILVEELGEAQQAAGKILRHGYESYNPDDCESDSNRQNLTKELGDVRYIITLMALQGDISEGRMQDRVKIKAKKIVPYLHHQGEEQ